MTAVLEAPTFAGERVRLEPLRESHLDGLVAAAAEDRATYGFTTVPNGRDAMSSYVETMLRRAGWASSSRSPRSGSPTINRSGSRATSACGFGRRTALPYAVEVGGTWLAASAQRSGINIEAKLLLLTYAFEEWTVGRVDFKTDARNQRSRDAIAALGAKFEAVLRNWQPSHAAGEEGQLRDTAMFSILDTGWPAVRELLTARLTGYRTSQIS